MEPRGRWSEKVWEPLVYTIPALFVTTGITKIYDETGSVYLYVNIWFD
jgi:hypothetical protein